MKKETKKVFASVQQKIDVVQDEHKIFVKILINDKQFLKFDFDGNFDDEYVFAMKNMMLNMIKSDIRKYERGVVPADYGMLKYLKEVQIEEN